MAKPGRLTKDKFGFTMPVDAPLVCKPYYYFKTEAMFFEYETDEEAALDILPEGLELPSPATASVIIWTHSLTSFGPYREAHLRINCTWQGEPRTYYAYLFVDSDQAMANGREVWGYPKKLANITFQKEGGIMMGTVERPRGYRICTALIKPEVRVASSNQTEIKPVPDLSLRVFPSTEEGAEPSVMELIEVSSLEFTIHDEWQGPGIVQFDGSSPFDPWHKISVKKMLSATYRCLDAKLGYGRVIKRY